MDSTGAVPVVSALFREMAAIVEGWKNDLENLKRRILEAQNALKSLQSGH